MWFGAAGPRRHRFTVDDYYRMGDIGILEPDSRVELLDGTIFDKSPPAPEPRRHLLTVADYYAMGRAGILAPDAPVEIIGGEVVDMAPIDSRHAATVETLANLLRQAVEGFGIVRTKRGITLDPYSEPIPHVTLLKPQSQNLDVRPLAARDVLLIIEVADTSLAFERDVKIPLYADHRIPEVWLVDPQGRQLLRYRQAQWHGYALADRPNLSAPLEITTLPTVAVDLKALFPSS